MSLLDLIDEKRPEILRLAAKHGAHDLRLFGSVARGEEHEGSDVDLLAEVPSYDEYFELQQALEQLLGVHVDVVTSPHPLIAEQMLADAIPLEADNFREQAVIQSQRPRPPLDRNKFHLQRMREAAEEVIEFTASGRTALDTERMRRAAVIGSLIQLGGAARAVSRDFRDHHPEIPWSKMVGFRNIAVHEYYKIDWDKVWDITQLNVPELIQALDKLI